VTSQIYFVCVSEEKKTGLMKFITQKYKWMFGAQARTEIVKQW